MILDEKLAIGETLLMDGAVGAEVERFGGRMDSAAWCGLATETHPAVVCRVHAEYLKAGSDIATANEDGTYTVSMGCGADAVNNLPISNETGVFNFTVRHYIPSDRVKFDEYRLMPLMQKVD